jgi:hypothetical protein
LRDLNPQQWSRGSKMLGAGESGRRWLTAVGASRWRFPNTRACARLVFKLGSIGICPLIGADKKRRVGDRTTRSALNGRRSVTGIHDRIGLPHHVRVTRGRDRWGGHSGSADSCQKRTIVMAMSDVESSTAGGAGPSRSVALMLRSDRPLAMLLLVMSVSPALAETKKFPLGHFYYVSCAKLALSATESPGT